MSGQFLLGLRPRLPRVDVGDKQGLIVDRDSDRVGEFGPVRHGDKAEAEPGSDLAGMKPLLHLQMATVEQGSPRLVFSQV